MENITLTIDNIKVTVPQGTTVLEAAEAAGIRIPTLCHIKDIDPRANCRMCLVQIENMRTPQPSCATEARDGMVVCTNSDRLERGRKMNLEAILANHAVDCHHCMRIGSSSEESLDPKFCEMCFWCDCERDGFCELQSLARQYGVDLLQFSQRGYDHPVDDSLSIVRNPNKCIKCRRCVDICNTVQTVHNLSVMNRGTDTMIVPELGKMMKDSPCVRCGRCAEVCPTGAIHMKEHIDEEIYFAHSYGHKTAALVPEEAIAELESLFDPDNKAGQRKLRMENPKPLDTRKVSSHLRKIGMDKVFSDVPFKAASRAEGERKLAEACAEGRPVIITDSPAAVNFVEQFFPQAAENLVVYRTPQEIFNDYIKGEYAASNGIDPQKIRTYALTTRNEDQAASEEKGSIDYAFNAREFFRLALRSGGNMEQTEPREFDTADLVCETLQNEAFFAEVPFDKKGGICEAEVAIGGKTCRAAIASNLGLVRELLADGCRDYDIVRILA